MAGGCGWSCIMLNEGISILEYLARLKDSCVTAVWKTLTHFSSLFWSGFSVVECGMISHDNVCENEKEIISLLHNKSFNKEAWNIVGCLGLISVPQSHVNTFCHTWVSGFLFSCVFFCLESTFLLHKTGSYPHLRGSTPPFFFEVLNKRWKILLQISAILLKLHSVMNYFPFGTTF